MPLNIPVKIGELQGSISIVSVLGLMGIGAILIFHHPHASDLGESPVRSGSSRESSGTRSIGDARIVRSLEACSRDWVRHHVETLTNAGELEMLDAYKAAEKIST